MHSVSIFLLTVKIIYFDLAIVSSLVILNLEIGSVLPNQIRKLSKNLPVFGITKVN